MLSTRQPSILVTPNKIAGPHFKSSGYERNLTLHQTLLYRTELLIFIYTPIKPEVSVAHWFLFSWVFYKNTTHTAFVIKATEDRENGLWLFTQDLGKGEAGLCNLLDIAESKTKNGFLRTHFPASRGLARWLERRTQRTWHWSLWRSGFKSGKQGSVYVCDVHEKKAPKQEKRKVIQSCS